ncbi:carboxypeptidase-like regulatory domain-containing protein [Flavobacterium sp. N1736]|uniref:carboxypeptidase-like regulatory domain-containing protein n=1 Tax=Flavobacterium sp. N1736 TaxID=2986823 RepID=UPI002224C43D|nr:carboxypeptidase-like regulatory domain-containing protein [Flavobacterium sp. N1736]
MKKLMTNFIHWNANHRTVPLILFLLLTSNFISAQVKVSGVISDEKGLSIPGANISIAGSKTTASTDFDGKYTIDAPANATLVFSFIGFNTQKIAVDGKTTINVVLKAIAEDLRDVVVIGYGTQKRKDINSAISSINSKDIENLKVASFDQMLQGKAAGVVVNSNSGEREVMFR